jgi:succinate-semialdehyde dehydrogenase / glutarate-semialdehyde dehydrogenase
MTATLAKLLERPLETALLIGGASRTATSGATYPLLSPATREVLCDVPDAGEADLEAAVGAARDAQKAWAALTAYQRESITRKATAFVRGKADEIGRLMALESGKPFTQSKSEVVASCDTIDYYAAEGVRLEGYSNPTEAVNVRSNVIYQPIGVAALIVPWNYPLSLLSWKLGPALAAGCSSIVKPSPQTPLCTVAFCKALLEGGLPAGVVGVLTGSSAELGKALVVHEGVDKIAMTGSTATGKRILESVASQLKKVSLELGGHAPAIVCADADVKTAAKIIAYKGFRNMGQSCSSVNRVYAHESIAAELEAELKALAEKLSIGDGVTDGSVDLGPMATPEAREKVEAHVQDALARGATLVAGGKRPLETGNYYTPTVLAGVPDDALMMHEETFGPVVPIATFSSLEEAIERANDTPYGLVAYLFARDYATITRVSEALEAGTVCVNNGAVNTNYGPYEGWKESGFGVELGRRGIMEYVKTKHVKVQF